MTHVYCCNDIQETYVHTSSKQHLGGSRALKVHYRKLLYFQFYPLMLVCQDGGKKYGVPIHILKAHTKASMAYSSTNKRTNLVVYTFKSQ